MELQPRNCGGKFTILFVVRVQKNHTTSTYFQSGLFDGREKACHQNPLYIQGAVCMDPLQPGDILTLRIKDQSAKNFSICNDAPERMVKQAIMPTMGLILKLTFRVLRL